MKIEFKNVSKSFKKVCVLNDVNYTFESGHIYGLLGRNGSGKSVLLKLISGYYVPSKGEILYDGVNLNLKKEFPSNLRALIESPSFYPDLSGYKNLKMLADINSKISDKEILDSLDIVNLTNEKDKVFSEYSLGMKQKLGFAQVIMENPNIYIFDEPFNGIEKSTVDKLIYYLNSIKSDDKIIIISSHIKEDLDRLCDVLIEIDNGNIVR